MEPELGIYEDVPRLCATGRDSHYKFWRKQYTGSAEACCFYIAPSPRTLFLLIYFPLILTHFVSNQAYFQAIEIKTEKIDILTCTYKVTKFSIIYVRLTNKLPWTSKTPEKNFIFAGC